MCFTSKFQNRRTGRKKACADGAVPTCNEKVYMFGGRSSHLRESICSVLPGNRFMNGDPKVDPTNNEKKAYA
jgi:hypothetical protein